MQTRKQIAECFGVDVRTIQWWESKGVVPVERVQNLSPPCMDLIRGDTNWTLLIPANDDVAELPPPLTVTGYQGRNVSLTAEQVVSLAERYPALADDIGRHLGELEDSLSRVPHDNRPGTMRRLMGYRSKLVRSRQRFDRKAA